ncbi:hypothetical protein FAIPA1_90076 [Frankia sp. AiPs1]
MVQAAGTEQAAGTGHSVGGGESAGAEAVGGVEQTAGVRQAGGTARMGAVPAMCATCGQRPAEDTQCRPCREDRQQRAEQEFAAWWEQVRRGRRTDHGPSHLPSGVLPSS